MTVTLPEDFDHEWFVQMDSDWMADAVCGQTDPELFFPDIGGSPFEAKKLCLSCPVRQQCDEYAMRLTTALPRPLQGVWGGYTQYERRLRLAGVETPLTKPCRGCGIDMPTGNAGFHSEACGASYNYRKNRKGEAA